MLFVFFFQAEDGIRDRDVTGVQTCALPISWPEEWGGTGWNVAQRYIFEEECGYVGTPPLIPFGLTMCAAVLLRFEIGRASCRERGEVSGGAGALKKKERGWG